MRRPLPQDKPIRPWKEALADTWVFPALTTLMAGLHWLPDGGDWLLRFCTASCVVVSLLAYGGAVQLHRRRARWLHRRQEFQEYAVRYRPVRQPFSDN